MVDTSTLSVVVAAASVVFGVLFAMFQLRNLVKTRQTDLVLRLYSGYASREFKKHGLKPCVWNSRTTKTT